MTYEEFKTNLWTLLNLDNHAITFTIVDSEFGTTVESGIVECTGDLCDTDFTDLCMDYDGETVQVYSVESWMVGDGEADHADLADLGLIQAAMDKMPQLFDEFIRDCADNLCSLGDFEFENPYYDDDNSNDDYDD